MMKSSNLHLKKEGMNWMLQKDEHDNISQKILPPPTAFFSTSTVHIHVWQSTDDIKWNFNINKIRQPLQLWPAGLLMLRSCLFSVSAIRSTQNHISVHIFKDNDHRQWIFHDLNYLKRRDSEQWINRIWESL